MCIVYIVFIIAIIIEAKAHCTAAAVAACSAHMHPAHTLLSFSDRQFQKLQAFFFRAPIGYTQTPHTHTHPAVNDRCSLPCSMSRCAREFIWASFTDATIEFLYLADSIGAFEPNDHVYNWIPLKWNKNNRVVTLWYDDVIAKKNIYILYFASLLFLTPRKRKALYAVCIGMYGIFGAMHSGICCLQTTHSCTRFGTRAHRIRFAEISKNWVTRLNEI